MSQPPGIRITQTSTPNVVASDPVSAVLTTGMNVLIPVSTGSSNNAAIAAVVPILNSNSSSSAAGGGSVTLMNHSFPNAASIPTALHVQPVSSHSAVIVNTPTARVPPFTNTTNYGVPVSLDSATNNPSNVTSVSGTSLHTFTPIATVGPISAPTATVTHIATQPTVRIPPLTSTVRPIAIQPYMAPEAMPSGDNAASISRPVIVTAPSTPAVANSRVGMDEALNFLEVLKQYYAENSPQNQEFMSIMKDFQDKKITTQAVVERVYRLFEDQPDLLERFNTFLPRTVTPAPSIEVAATSIGDRRVAQVSRVSAGTPQPRPSNTASIARSGSVSSASLHIPSSSVSSVDPMSGLLSESTNGAVPSVPHEVEDGNLKTAMNFVMTVMQRFTNQPDRYNHFIEILRRYNVVLQETNNPNTHRDANVQVRREVRKLFGDEGDLIDGFDQFLRQTTSSHFAGSSASDTLFSHHHIRSPAYASEGVAARRALVADATEPSMGSHGSRGASKRVTQLPGDSVSNRASLLRGQASDAPGRQRAMSTGSGSNVANSSVLRSNSTQLRSSLAELTRTMEGTPHESSFNECLKQWQEEVLDDASFVNRLQYFSTNAGGSARGQQQVSRLVQKIGNFLHVAGSSKAGEESLGHGEAYLTRDTYEEGSDVLDDDDDADDQVLLEEDEDDDDYTDDGRGGISEEPLIDDDSEMREILEATPSIPVLPGEEGNDPLRFLPITSRTALGRQRQNSSIITPVTDRATAAGKGAQRRRRRVTSINVDGMPNAKASKKARFQANIPSPNPPSSGGEEEESLAGVSSDEEDRPRADIKRPTRGERTNRRGGVSKEEPVSENEEPTRRPPMSEGPLRQISLRDSVVREVRERCCKSYYRLRPNERPPPSTDPIGREVLNTEYVSCAQVAAQPINEEEDEGNESEECGNETVPKLELAKMDSRDSGLLPSSSKQQVMGSGRRKRRHQQPQPWPQHPHHKHRPLGTTTANGHAIHQHSDHLKTALPAKPSGEDMARDDGAGGTSSALLRSPTTAGARCAAPGGSSGSSPQEHLFQVEDERYEMDNVVDMNVYAMQELATLRRKILANPDAPEFKAANFKLEKLIKHSFLTVYRAIQRLYGEKVDTIIHLLNDCPTKGLDLIISRMEQKHREWSYVRRFFQRGWYQNTMMWYYRALDVYGYSNKPKNDDLAQFRNKALVDEVLQHARQAENLPSCQRNDAVHIHTHQATACPSFEQQSGSDSSSSLVCSPLNDAVELVVHSVKRLCNTYKEDKSVMKRIVRCILPPLLNAQPLPMSEDEPEDDDEEESSERRKKTPIEKPDEGKDAAVASHSPSDTGDRLPADVSAKSPTSNCRGVGGSNSCWWQSGAIDEKRFGHIRHALFEVPERRNRFRHLDLETYLQFKREDDLKYNLFYANDNWLLIIRLFLILCTRLTHFARLSKQLQQEDTIQQAQREKLGTGDALHSLLGVAPPDSAFDDRYQEFLRVFADFMDGALDSNLVYEDRLRELFGTQAYPLYSLDKLVTYIVKQLQQCASSNAGLALLTLHQQFLRHGKMLNSVHGEASTLEQTYEQVSLLICNCPGLLNSSPAGEASSSENDASSSHPEHATTSVITNPEAASGNNSSEIPSQQERRPNEEVLPKSTTSPLPPLAPFLTSEMLGDSRQQSDCFRVLFIPQRQCVWMQVLDRITPAIVDDDYAEMERRLKLQFMSNMIHQGSMESLPSPPGDKAILTWQDYLLSYVHSGMSDDAPPQTVVPSAAGDSGYVSTTQSITQEFVARSLFAKLKEVPLFRVRTVRRVVQKMAKESTSADVMKTSPAVVPLKEEEEETHAMETDVKEEPSALMEVGECCDMAKANPQDEAAVTVKDEAVPGQLHESDSDALLMDVETNGLKRGTCQLAKVIFKVDLQPEQVFHNTICTERLYERDWSAARNSWSGDSYGVLIRSRPHRKPCIVRKERFQEQHHRWESENLRDQTCPEFLKRS